MRPLPVLALVVALLQQPAAAQSGAGQYFRDEAIVMKVVSKLQFNRQLMREKIDVKANQGIVTLSGNVSSAELAALAGKLAAEASGVLKVNNALRVGAQGQE